MTLRSINCSIRHQTYTVDWHLVGSMNASFSWQLYSLTLCSVLLRQLCILLPPFNIIPGGVVTPPTLCTKLFIFFRMVEDRALSVINLSTSACKRRDEFDTCVVHSPKKNPGTFVARGKTPQAGGDADTLLTLFCH